MGCPAYLCYTILTNAYQSHDQFVLRKVHLQQSRVIDVHNAVEVYIRGNKLIAGKELEFSRVPLNRRQ